MSSRTERDGRRVVVVTGGAVGIGAAIAEECGRRGHYVVTLDPVLALDGSPGAAPAGPTTAERIVAAGGAARASNVSVTDGASVSELFAGLIREFGALDAVVNVAGISRSTGFATGSDEDWSRVLDVHLNGYLTVLRSALPLMARAAHGRILGVTSGSGWRAADAGAYSAAKRAVSSLTWQIGRVAPAGVVVNALSPIAATRMVTGALARLARSGGGDASGRSASSGGLALGAAPPPEHLGPVGAYLAGGQFTWCSGQVVFSNGAEVSMVSAPRLMEVLRAADVVSLAHAIDAALPGAFAAAETAQASNGGSVPRFGPIFGQAGGGAPVAGGVRCAIVADDPARAAGVAEVLDGRGVKSTVVETGARPGECPGFAVAAQRFARSAGDGPLDAVVVALGGPPARAPGAGWERVLAEHDGIADAIRADASWVRAAVEHAAHAGQPLRVVTLTDAESAGGRSRAMASAQLSRASRTATSNLVDAFSIAVASSATSAWRAAAELAGALLCSPAASSLSGAEFVADSDWVGLRAHPRVLGTVTYGGPEVPGWVDGALRRILHGEFES